VSVLEVFDERAQEPEGLPAAFTGTLVQVLSPRMSRASEVSIETPETGPAGATQPAAINLVILVPRRPFGCTENALILLVDEIGERDPVPPRGVMAEPVNLLAVESART
jgi:hypothetical protein